ncbi:MAG: PQQ-like beta-propeller repeat protein, partial [Planctomycetes bacterium]|nr:PQQ-like beta-propeller repeat protein [Planctomycetota bacterium]
MSIFLRTLTLLCILSPLLAVESRIMVATWELNQQVSELRQDIVMQQGSINQLLDRCQTLFQEHPNHLVQTGKHFASVQKVILADLHKQDLLQEWKEHINVQANEQLTHIPTGQLNQLVYLAQSYPYSDAAEAAWQRLADIAWDRGQLGSFLFYNRQISRDGEHDAARLKAALEMVKVISHKPVPSSLHNVDVMWSEDLPAIHKNNKQQTIMRNGQIVRKYSSSKGKALSYTPSHGDDSVLALNNGSYLLIIDPLLGRKLGNTHIIGSSNRRSMMPSQSCVGNSIILTSTFTDEGAGLLACDQSGNQIWHETLNQTSSSNYVSRPVILDNIAFIAFISYANSSERLELAAFDLMTGKAKWRRTLAQMNGANARFNSRSIKNLNPDICVHKGHLAVLSNRGVIAECTAGGHILNLSSYDRQSKDNQFGQFDRSISVNTISREG